MGPIFLLPLCLTKASRHHIFPHLGEGGTFLSSNREVSSSTLVLYLAEAGRHHISLFFLISFFSFFILSFFFLLSEDASFVLSLCHIPEEKLPYTPGALVFMSRDLVSVAATS